MSDTVLVRDEGGVRLLTMNRPEKLNALDNELTATLLGALHAAQADPAIAVVVLTGAGRAFCAGADVTEFKHLTADNPAAIQARGDLTMKLHAAFNEISKPVIGAVNGHAMGGGCGLALACDLLVAAAVGAKFAYPEVKRGAVPAIVLANLVRQVSLKAACELVMLCETIGAGRALELGMVNRVVPDEALIAETMGMARAMAAWNRDALQATKRLLHRVAGLPLAPALEVARDANIIMRGYNVKKTV
ncbi:MAG TPA: enoyl-CoA hydratase/isomerase family protein [Burkholderiales bacterium]|jgi:enoyl-CoA hydratase/carnithine racemase|nr:enoyl-CoA hydratase/isomerase family protein [Burkholderiales bacterium]